MQRKNQPGKEQISIALQAHMKRYMLNITYYDR